MILDLGLEEQFREILLGDDFPHLKSVIFENVSEFVHMFIPSYVSRPHQAVKEVCKEARVTFRVRKGHRLLKGGKRLPWLMQACRMRRLRENKQEILTEDEASSDEDPSDSESDVAICTDRYVMESGDPLPVQTIFLRPVSSEFQPGQESVLFQSLEKVLTRKYQRVVTGEIFPLKVRAKALSITTATNWLLNWAIAYSTPYLVNYGPGDANQAEDMPKEESTGRQVSRCKRQK